MFSTDWPPGFVSQIEPEARGGAKNRGRKPVAACYQALTRELFPKAVSGWRCPFCRECKPSAGSRILPAPEFLRNRTERCRVCADCAPGVTDSADKPSTVANAVPGP